jgi:hypothetical protein
MLLKNVEGSGGCGKLNSFAISINETDLNPIEKLSMRQIAMDGT